MKNARITDGAHDTFGLDYDNTLGKRNSMRLDAETYEQAVREARSFLGLNADNLDADGDRWEIE